LNDSSMMPTTSGSRCSNREKAAISVSSMSWLALLLLRADGHELTLADVARLASEMRFMTKFQERD
jgi:hypothetical protein